MNRIADILIDLGLSSEGSINPFHKKVRDRSDVSVSRCSKSGVILLSTTNHMEEEHYEEQIGFEYWGASDRRSALIATKEDTRRRTDSFAEVVANRDWMDVGTGAGGILDTLAANAKDVVAVEPQRNSRMALEDLGYNTFPFVKDVDRAEFDVVTLFHVFEHLLDPIGLLKEIKDKMKVGGRVFVEIPHAQDFLISFLEHEGFKDFSFWSEHLLLHTRHSLQTFMEAAGFGNITIQGIQRYPLSNHLHWLAKNKPGGHQKWSELNSPELKDAYTNMLANLNMTDTLMASATKVN